MKKFLTAIVFLLVCTVYPSSIVLADNEKDETIYSEMASFVNDNKEYSAFFEDVLHDLEDSEISEDNDAIKQYLNHILENAKEVSVSQVQLFQSVEERMNSISENSLYATSSTNDTYLEMVNLYRIGIGIVNACNCPNTARYMEHAIVPQGSTTNPSDIYETNTTWARTLLYGCNELMWEIESRFEREIFPYGVSGSFSGTFEYTSSNCCLDARTALQHVNYIATFVRRADGNGYNMSFFLSDVYDFAWTDYDNFVIGFANNYCFGMQQAGYIRPYNIYITVI